MQEVHEKELPHFKTSFQSDSIQETSSMWMQQSSHWIPGYQLGDLLKLSRNCGNKMELFGNAAEMLNVSNCVIMFQ